MARKAVVDAVEARLASMWTDCPILGVNLDSEAPADGSAHVIVQYPVANEQQISIGVPGANVWREEGIIRFVINTERGGGETKALQWADDLGTIFRGKTFSGVTCWEVSSPRIDDGNDQGNFFQAFVNCRYWNDLIG